MRARDEIENATRGASTNGILTLILEVMLDLREMLAARDAPTPVPAKPVRKK